MENSPSVHKLEAKLCQIVGRKYCVATGRGASALHLVYSCLKGKGTKIIFPAILCPSPVNVAVSLGFNPVFCDVNLENGNLCVRALRNLILHTEDVTAIVAPHLYGNPAEIDTIKRMAHAAGIVLIEDVAQAFGGCWKGKSLGAWGDFSILSFGHSKPLDFGGGGAVLTDNPEFYSLLAKKAEELPPLTESINTLAGKYKEVYYSLERLYQRDVRLSPLFFAMPEIFAGIYVFRLSEDQAQIIIKGLESINDIVVAHRRNAALYNDLMPKHETRCLTQFDGSVPWRYTFLLENGNQKIFTEKLRSEGIDVSNWYPSLHRWYRSGKHLNESKLKNSMYLEKHVVNLWVDRSIDEKRIRKTCALIHKFVKSNLDYR